MRVSGRRHFSFSLKVGSIEKRGGKSRGKPWWDVHENTRAQRAWTRVELEEESSLFHAQGRAAEQRDDFLILSFCILFLLAHFRLPFSPFASCFFFSFSFLLCFSSFVSFLLFGFQCCEFRFLWQTKLLRIVCTRCDALARLRSNSDNSVSWKSYALALTPPPPPTPSTQHPTTSRTLLLSSCSSHLLCLP